MPQPPAPKKAAPAPLDTLRMSQEEKRKLVAYVESQGKTVADSRRRLRIDFHGRKVFGRLSHAGQRGPLCALVPRNLSALGFSFVHGAFVNSGMRCQLTLPMLGGRWCEVAGEVRRCRHIQGIVHEVSVVFDAEVDLAELVTLTPEQRRRLEREALGGVAPAAPASAAPAPSPAVPAPASSLGVVLLVDPDPAVRAAVSRALAAAGFSASAHASNHAARAAVAGGFDGSAPVAAVLSGGTGPARAGVAELRFDPVALVSHLRRAGLSCPVLLRPVVGDQGAALAKLQRRAAVAGVTGMLDAAADAEALAAAVVQHVEHASGGGAGPLRSLHAGDPAAAERVAAFRAKLPGCVARLGRPGSARDADALRPLGEDLAASATAAGFPPIAEAARGLLAAIDGHAPAAPAIAALTAVLRACQAAAPGAAPAPRAAA